MKKRIIGLGFLLLLSMSVVAAESDRKHVVLRPSAARSALPFSDAVLVGNTLYLAGTLGLDAATGKPPAGDRTGSQACHGWSQASPRERGHEYG